MPRPYPFKPSAFTLPFFRLLSPSCPRYTFFLRSISHLKYTLTCILQVVIVKKLSTLVMRFCGTNNLCGAQWRLRTKHTIVQHPGQYVIVKPGVLRWDYNSGANTAEAANFAFANHNKEACDPTGYRFIVCKSGYT